MAGCVLLAFILLKRPSRYFGRRRYSGAATIERVPQPTRKWDGTQRDTLAQVERQKVEMREMSRGLNDQLGSKIIILERLVAQSQQQIERLEHLLDETEAAY